jgi:hypothetical protein
MSQNPCVLNYKAITSIELCLSNQNSCFALEKSGASCTVPQASCWSGCTVLKVTPITVALHPSTAYKYHRLHEFSSQLLSSSFFQLSFPTRPPWATSVESSGRASTLVHLLLHVKNQHRLILLLLPHRCRPPNRRAHFKGLHLEWMLMKSLLRGGDPGDGG